MLRGIDVSSWQGDIQVQNMPIDFVISKATEGISYVNPKCDGVITRAKQSGKLFGFYHYAQYNDPVAECDFFIDNCIGYLGYGIPVLDWEENQSVDWVNQFVRRYHERTNVWPWIYANPWRFNQGGVESNCGRWIASYPNVIRPGLDYDPGTVPDTDGLVACWQYASDGVVSGYDGNLDVNIYYGDAESWLRYTGQSNGYGDVDTPANEKVITVEDENYRVDITHK